MHSISSLSEMTKGWLGVTGQRGENPWNQAQTQFQVYPGLKGRKETAYNYSVQIHLEISQIVPCWESETLEHFQIEPKWWGILTQSLSLSVNSLTVHLLTSSRGSCASFAIISNERFLSLEGLLNVSCDNERWLSRQNTVLLHVLLC